MEGEAFFMSRSLKMKLIYMVTFTLIVLLLAVFIVLRIQGVFGVYLHLIGEKEVIVEIHEPYIEEGVFVRKNFKKIDTDIKIQHHVDTSRLGEYEVSYMVEDKRIIRKVIVKDTKPPLITLIGDEIEVVFQNEEYHEKGVKIVDNSQADLQKDLKIKGTIHDQKVGDYKMIYEVQDEAGNKAMVERIVRVVENPLLMKLHYHYDALNNERLGWWFKKANDHERKLPSFPLEKLKKYQGYYLGKDEKVIYLTFDEGGNTVSYIKEITEILNHQNVQATYFLTRNYIAKEAEFMRSLVLKGHEIGNHTRRHLDMTSLANRENMDRFILEIMETEKTIHEMTKQSPVKIFRFPKGDYSERSLAIVHDLGYKTYFWSHAYNDYSGDVSGKEAYNNLVSHLHNGAIYLLHPANKGNYEAMEDFILEAKRLGYTFDIVSHIE